GLRVNASRCFCVIAATRSIARSIRPTFHWSDVSGAPSLSFSFNSLASRFAAAIARRPRLNVGTAWFSANCKTSSETPSAVSFPDFAASSRLKATESTAVSALRNADSNFAMVVPGFGLNSHGRILVLRRPLRRSSELPARIVILPLYGILKSAIYYFLVGLFIAPKIPNSSTRGVATGRQQSIPPMAFWLIDAVAPRCRLGDRVLAASTRQITRARNTVYNIVVLTFWMVD